MAGEGGKKNPYGVTNDPMRGATNPLQSDSAGVDTSLKRKQRQSLEDEVNKPDPVGDFVRRITGANREKKKTGF